MKARVESERLPAGADPKLHLKLGPGGLADVEWTAQLLQLRVGGAQPAVRVQPTLDALGGPGRRRRPRPRPGGLAGRRLPPLPAHPHPRLPGRGPPGGLLPTDPVALERLAWAMGGPLAASAPRTTAAPPAAPAAWSTPASMTPLEHARPARPRAATRPAGVGSPRGRLPGPGSGCARRPQPRQRPALLVCVGDLMVDVAVEAPAPAGGVMGRGGAVGAGGLAANVAGVGSGRGGEGCGWWRAGATTWPGGCWPPPWASGGSSCARPGRRPRPAGRCWW